MAHRFNALLVLLIQVQFGTPYSCHISSFVQAPCLSSQTTIQRLWLMLHLVETKKVFLSAGVHEDGSCGALQEQPPDHNCRQPGRMGVHGVQPTRCRGLPCCIQGQNCAKSCGIVDGYVSRCPGPDAKPRPLHPLRVCKLCIVLHLLRVGTFKHEFLF